jgi:RloB-like protein
MSKKKHEKRPLSKKVITLIEELKRKRGVRDLAERFLIVCEDGKSAPNYFRALREHLNLTATSIEVAGSGGRTQPVQVVARAIELKNAASSDDSGTLPFDQTWCVIDGDYGDAINNARKSANANDIKLAITTKCFEYWVLLHFIESDTATMDCDGLVHSLKHPHIPDYEKGTCQFHDVVPHVHEAAERAERLRRPGIARRELPENQNPCSEVYKLIKAIFGTPYAD